MNAKQWRAEIDKVMQEVRDGKISISAANAFVKMFQVNVQSAQVQLNQYQMRKEKPDVEFLREE